MSQGSHGQTMWKLSVSAADSAADLSLRWSSQEAMRFPTLGGTGRSHGEAALAADLAAGAPYQQTSRPQPAPPTAIDIAGDACNMADAITCNSLFRQSECSLSGNRRVCCQAIGGSVASQLECLLSGKRIVCCQAIGVFVVKQAEMPCQAQQILRRLSRRTNKTELCL